MKRVPWILLVVAAVLIGTVIFLRKEPERPDPAGTPANDVTTPSAMFRPDLVKVTVPIPKPNLIDIQDGKTIDFSSGLPIIKDTEKDKAALERAVKEMEAAAAEVSFGSPQTPKN